MNINEAIKQVEQMGEYEHFVDEPISKKAVLNILKQIDTQPKPRVPEVAVEFYEAYKDAVIVIDDVLGATNYAKRYSDKTEAQSQA